MSERFFLIYTVWGYEDSDMEQRDFDSFDQLVAYMDDAKIPTEEATIIRGVKLDTSEAEAILKPLRGERQRLSDLKAVEARENRERETYERLKAKYGE